MTKRQSGKDSYDREYLEKLIEEAIIDCYNEHEQAVGMFTKIEEELDPGLCHDFRPLPRRSMACSQALT
jgi:hypothetical protein